MSETTNKKKEIVERLLPVLNLTREGARIKRLVYQNEGDAGEYVYGFEDLGDTASHFRIDVTADSELAMISEICNHFV